MCNAVIPWVTNIIGSRTFVNRNDNRYRAIKHQNQRRGQHFKHRQPFFRIQEEVFLLSDLETCAPVLRSGAHYLERGAQKI